MQSAGLHPWCSGHIAQPPDREPMLTGHNTDVTHRGRVFHVQTEDKGRSNPNFESLIYVGGQVLSAKRTSYAPLLEQGAGKDQLNQVMDRQHRSMIDEIREGKHDQRVAELLGEVPPPQEERSNGSDPASAERSLDEVILEYLSAEARQDHLVLMLQEEVELSFDRPTALSVCTRSSRSGSPVDGAEVVFKIISTVAEPTVLARGETDRKGELSVEVMVPDYGEGSSALIIAASSELGKAELKYLL
ncbi:MAG TPA: hypothetical protein VMT85_07415 [Thermoanaerobaculia bacterium]|nr:hypothetical protein [Thermoanaerobaculia bacterium]